MHANSWVRVYGPFILGDAAANFQLVLTLEEGSKEPKAEASHHTFKQSVAWSPCGLGRFCPISTHNPMYRTVKVFSKHIEWSLAWRTKSRHLAINTAAVPLFILSISKNFIMKIDFHNCHWNGNRFILCFFFSVTVLFSPQLKPQNVISVAIESYRIPSNYLSLHCGQITTFETCNWFYNSPAELLPPPPPPPPNY